MRPAAATALAAGAAAVGATTALRALDARPPGGRPRWIRRNFRGAELSLVGGPAVTAGVLIGIAVARVAGAPGPTVAGAALSAAGAGAFGLYDDLAGGTHARGFRGHLRAVRRGEVTSGLVKLAGIGATGLAAASGADRRDPLDIAIDGAVVAGAANLVNLLDLRPGRALKTILLAGLPVAMARCRGRGVAAAAVGAAIGVLPADLGERVMIGDAGANTLGAVLGVAAVAGRARVTRLALLGGVVGLTAASERVSFSAVIDRTPVLAALDRMGRLPS